MHVVFLPSRCPFYNITFLLLPSFLTSIPDVPSSLSACPAIPLTVSYFLRSFRLHTISLELVGMCMLPVLLRLGDA